MREHFKGLGILSWALVGLLAGWLTGVVKGSRDGLLTDLLIGMTGAILGGFLAGALFNLRDPISGFNLSTLLVAFLSSILSVVIVRALPGRSPV